MKKNQNGFGLVATVIVLTILVVVVASVVFVTKSTTECNNKYQTALAAAQPKITEFNKIALLGEQPVQQANIQRSGDCVDSSPYVTVTKTYSLNEKGATLVSKIRTNLKKEGYKVSKEDFGSEGCKLHYRVQAQNNGIKIYADAHQKELNDSTCNDGYPTGITESHYATQDIDSVFLRLEN